MSLVTRLRTVFDDVALDRFRWFLGDLPELSRREPPGCWRLLSQGEAEGWVRDHPAEREDKRRVHEVALRNNHLLFVASVDGMPVGRVWIGRGWIYSERPDYVSVHLAPDTAISYDMFIEKAYRRRGLAYDGFRFRLQTARRLGLRRYASGIYSGNRVGCRHMMELGLPWWDALRVRVGGHAAWLKGRPWGRIGDQVLKERV